MAVDQAQAPQNGPLLVPFTFWRAGDDLPARPPVLDNLRAAIAAHLADLGRPDAEPLRWAITAVDPERGLLLEGVAVGGSMPAGTPARL
ncbi:MAG: hypothetical protein VKM34_01275 [Cyanobacteriota bacterium]|nr:hypothetical protein [Cyanobacteriota bacterium]